MFDRYGRTKLKAALTDGGGGSFLFDDYNDPMQNVFLVGVNFQHKTDRTVALN